RKLQTHNERRRARSTKQSVSSPVLVPLEIHPSGGIERPYRKTVLHRIHGRTTQPFMYLGMSIRKREPTCRVMIRSGKIAPHRIINSHNKKRIIDRIRVFINREPCE